MQLFLDHSTFDQTSCVILAYPTPAGSGVNTLCSFLLIILFSYPEHQETFSSPTLSKYKELKAQDSEIIFQGHISKYRS